MGFLFANIDMAIALVTVFVLGYKLGSFIQKKRG